jgi:hypothetical protein
VTDIFWPRPLSATSPGGDTGRTSTAVVMSTSKVHGSPAVPVTGDEITAQRALLTTAAGATSATNKKAARMAPRACIHPEPLL